MAAPCNYKFGPNVTVPHELVSGLLVVEPEQGLIEKFLNILTQVAEKKLQLETKTYCKNIIKIGQINQNYI